MEFYGICLSPKVETSHFLVHIIREDAYSISSRRLEKVFATNIGCSRLMPVPNYFFQKSGLLGFQLMLIQNPSLCGIDGALAFQYCNRSVHGRKSNWRILAFLASFQCQANRQETNQQSFHWHHLVKHRNFSLWQSREDNRQNQEHRNATYRIKRCGVGEGCKHIKFVHVVLLESLKP